MGRNTKYKPVQEKEFQRRRLAVIDRLPENYVNQVILRMPEVRASRIQNVKYGNTVDFEILEVFEELAIERKIKK